MIESGSTRAGARVVPGPDTGRATVTEKEIRGEAGPRAIGLKQTAHLIGKKRNEITTQFQQITGKYTKNLFMTKYYNKFLEAILKI